MILKISDELFQILQQIISENKDESEWAQIEADDMFQSEHYCGGYDATEEAFTFSYYDPENVEWWFQLTLEEVQSILHAHKTEVTAVRAHGLTE